MAWRRDQPLTYDLLAALTLPDDMPRVVELTTRARDPALRESPAIEYRIRRPSGDVRWLRATGESIFEDGPQGPRATRYIGTVEDVTERRLLEERLRASEARLQLALSAGRMAVFDWPLDQPQPVLTPELRHQLGLGEGEESTLEERRARYHPDDLALASATRERALSGQERFIDFEFRYFPPGAEMRWLQVRSEVIRDAEGAPERLVGVQSDVTERRAAEERVQLLSREVDHRANNLLAVVQGVVSLSKAGHGDELREVVLGRISALARAHQLLSESRWAGADLRRLLEEELRPFGLGAPGRFALEGPDCALSAAEAQGMAMALHELATNAVKYGALSAPQGAVEVGWRVEKGLLELSWRERGGPPAKAPGRSGLGMTLLARALSGALGGGIEMRWAPAGLSCALRLPLAGARGGQA